MSILDNPPAPPAAASEASAAPLEAREFHLNQDHASAPPHTAETMLDTQGPPARPTACDKELTFKICDRFGNGESLEAILAEPGMPHERTFFRWLDEDSEVAERFRVSEEVREIFTGRKMEEEAKEKKKRAEAKYGAHGDVPLDRPAPGAVNGERARLCRSAHRL
jgi:hypothetical protein